MTENDFPAPRVTSEHIDACIASVEYHRLPNTTVTICSLNLVNGFSVRGESACVSPENFNEELGQSIAFRNARDKIWPLEGYLLAQRLHEAKQ